MNRILFSTDGADAAGAAPTPAPAPLTDAQRIAIAVKAYYDAVSREDKAAVVKQYPELEFIFSAGNHS